MKTRLIAGFLCLVLAGLAFLLDLDYFAFSWGSSYVQIYAAAALAFLGLLLIVTFRRQAS
jgi:hypothetical protein